MGRGAMGTVTESKTQTWLGTKASAAKSQVLPYTAPNVERMAAMGTRRLGEYFNGPARCAKSSQILKISQILP